MKILYVSQYFPPEMGAPSARVSELARLWTRAEHDVTVLTGFPNHPTGILAPAYRRAIWRLVKRERVNGHSVVRTWLWPLPNRKAHERIRNYASFCISAALTGSFLSRPDVVIGSSPQLLVAFAAWWISLVKRVPFVFEVRDLWPESLIAVGAASEASPLYRALGWIAGFLYKRADQIVVVTPAFKAHLVARWGVAPAKIAVIENGVDAELFRSDLPGDEARANLGLEDRFVIAYIGTMGNAHGLETLLSAAAVIQQKLPEAFFLLVGEGAEKERLIAWAEAKGLRNVRLVSEQAREYVPTLLAAADLCVVLLKKREVFRTVLPTKMLEMMSCGRPVVLGVEGIAQALLQEAQAGIAFEPENVNSLINVILTLHANPELRSGMGKRGAEYIRSRFSRCSTSHGYADVLARVAGSVKPKARLQTVPAPRTVVPSALKSDRPPVSSTADY